MKQTSKRILTALLAAALSLSCLTACKSDTSSPSSGTSIPSGDTATPPDPDELSVTGADVKSVGEFTTQNLNGESVTQDIFAEHKLTMVNVFTTWCTPCVQEMPELEKLHQQVKDQDVGVVGVVLDVLNEKGEIVDEDLERAQQLVETTGVTYPVLLPDMGYLNGRLIDIDAFPETFFVDKDGNIVGDHYSGSGGLEDWLEVVNNELANLEAGK